MSDKLAEYIRANTELAGINLDLNARLAEAEMLLDRAKGHVPDDTAWIDDELGGYLLDRIEQFLTAADSASCAHEWEEMLTLGPLLRGWKCFKCGALKEGASLTVSGEHQ
jgi:hypothetical protein